VSELVLVTRFFMKSVYFGEGGASLVDERVEETKLYFSPNLFINFKSLFGIFVRY
jgi:hypothetical protein